MARLCVLRSGRARRGVTLIELVMALFLFSFVIAGASRLLIIGQRQQTLAQNYSQDQTDARSAMRDMTRAIRHSFGVVASSSSFGATAVTSGATRIIVRVPYPSAANKQLMYYLSGNTLYKQYAGDASSTALMTGVNQPDDTSTSPYKNNGAIFQYYQTVGTARSTAPTVNQATDVQITIKVSRKGLPPTESAIVTMRNVILGY